MEDTEYVEEVAHDAELPSFAYRDREFDNEMTSYERERMVPTPVQIPIPVRKFLQFFAKSIAEHNLPDILSCYDSSWKSLSSNFYPDRPWPSAEEVAPLVKGDATFLTLYKELAYRHIYASKGLISLEHRFSSFENYCDLFNFILNADQPAALELPNQWLWDIINEFIYQFQTFCQFRFSPKLRRDEIEALKENPQIWNVHSVLNVLYSLIEKSKIQEQLVAARQGQDVSEAAGEFGSRIMYKMLGYFSIIGLLRLHCLLGDYHLALQVMSNIDLKQKSEFNRVIPCYITTYYYVGFCYLMMRRYQDAASTFSQALTFISRIISYHTRSFQYDMINKQNEQMYSLLAIAISLSPQRIDEGVSKVLKEKHGEKLEQVLQGENFEDIFVDWFSYSCPKFIFPHTPDYESERDPQAPMHHQLALFKREVRQQSKIPMIRSYLRLYTSMSTEKLAGFLEVSTSEVNTHLLCYKHKTMQKKWKSGNAYEGEYTSLAETNFYLKEDMIHINETRQARRFGGYFIGQINKFDDILENWAHSAK